MLPERKTLPHETPSWVTDGSEYFITICTHPRGQNQLCHAEIAEQIRTAFWFYQSRGDLWVHLLLLMPDHLHAILSFNRDPGMQTSIKEFKKYTAKRLGIIWQRDFFDHRLRAGESYAEKAWYIRMNPVRAGLIETPDEWPYGWENR
jgi:REP element-mobilizing transposase RayT